MAAAAVERAAPGANTRAYALRALDAAARYFESVDPHSPVSYRLRTAERWLARPATQVLADFVPAEHLPEVLRVLGYALGGADGTAAGAAADEAAGAGPGGAAGAGQSTESETQGAAGELGEGGAAGDGSQAVADQPSGSSGGAAAEPPLPTPLSRPQAIELIAAVKRYLDTTEPHSLANFPLALAGELANVPLTTILDRAITNEDLRERLSRELGVAFPARAT